jgi:hypothetical protein
MFLDAVGQEDGAAQLQYLPQVEGRITGWVSGEEASVQYLGTELVETASIWLLAQGDSRSRYFGAFQDLAACGKISES